VVQVAVVAARTVIHSLKGFTSSVNREDLRIILVGGSAAYIIGTGLHPVYEARGGLEALNAVLLDGAEAAKLLLEGVVYSLNSHNIPRPLELKLVEESIKIGLTLLS
jgi:hypothetical protein